MRAERLLLVGRTNVRASAVWWHSSCGSHVERRGANILRAGEWRCTPKNHRLRRAQRAGAGRVSPA